MEANITEALCAYSAEAMREQMTRLARRYTFLKQRRIGLSAEGKEIPVLIWGRGEKKILAVGAHHGREYVSSVFLMREAELMSRLYEENASVLGIDMRRLFQMVSVFFVPMLNPDGVNISVFGKKAAKCPDKIGQMELNAPNFSAWKANANGVDLNRQYPALWEKKRTEPFPAAHGFKGYKAASEPEVRALMRLCRAECFALAASFHSKGEEIYWADAGSLRTVKGARETALRLSQLTGYTLMPPSMDPYIYAAGFENWFRQEFKRAGFLFELCPYDGEMPYDMSCFECCVWEKAKLIVPFLAAYG